ncbi:hypothetical protein [Mycoplasmopsis bovis]|uniref:hypothetical protein n=1 Tax=Mycoplasmopsis bovis TaxID=28903 RepID=UPI00114EC425|nr:hypothetical protein [Mycoplasmopsis bovis]TQF55550.1 hypothetical protein A9508_00015 [Mycoplasmopsis bovis]
MALTSDHIEKNKIKSSLLPLDADIDVKNRRANFFLHFDHPEFDPTANSEVFNSIEVEFSYNHPNGQCEDLEAETINRAYKLHDLSEELRNAIYNAIESEVDEYIKVKWIP